jgi:hypothetical protein
MAISGSPLTEPSQSTRSRYSSFFKLAGVGVALAMTLVAVPNIASAAPPTTSSMRRSARLPSSTP